MRILEGRPSPINRIKQDREALVCALKEAGAVFGGDDAHIRCFHHDEKSGSLSIYNHNGVWRFKCHTCGVGGTVVDVIVKADGLDVSAAMKAAIERYAKPDTFIALPAPAMAPAPRYIFPTLDNLIDCLSAKLVARCTRIDDYKNPASQLVMLVLRFDNIGQPGKHYRPAHPVGGGWAIGDPVGMLPLFNLPDLYSRPSEQVYVVEGEKAAAALMRAGYLATTSAHGAKSPSRSDWTPLAGRAVCIWPDNDDAGFHYRDEVRGILGTLTPVPTITEINLTKLGVALPIGGDAHDFFSMMGAQ